MNEVIIALGILSVVSFSLSIGTAIDSERLKRRHERLCRYVGRMEQKIFNEDYDDEL